jgi:hypothetical protein
MTMWSMSSRIKSSWLAVDREAVSLRLQERSALLNLGAQFAEAILHEVPCPNDFGYPFHDVGLDGTRGQRGRRALPRLSPSSRE